MEKYSCRVSSKKSHVKYVHVHYCIITAIQVLVKLVELLARDNGLARETWKEDGIKDKEQWSRSIHSAV
jgi:hypothetical protein